MKLYDRQGTPNAARIRIVLAEKRLDDAVELIPVDLRAAAQKTPEFLAMNPMGKTPVLVLDDGLALSECPAITEYLDNLDGDPRFVGKTPREKALVHMWQRRVEIMLMEPIDDYFHYATPGLGEALRPWRMPDWDGKRDWAERRGALATANFPYYDALLRERPFLTGETFTMADITLWAALAFARPIKLPMPDVPALDAFIARVNDIPCVANRTGQSF